MKKIHTTMIVGLMAGIVLLAGCKREHGTVTLGANIDNGRDAKVYIDNLTPCWHNNDLIRVNNQTCTTSAALGSSAQITDVVESNHYRAIYPADIVGDVDISSSSTIAVTLPREQIFEVDSRGDQKVKVPMGAYSSSESLIFHNLCPLIKVVVSNRMDNDFVLEHITVTAATSYLSGLCSASVTGSPNDYIGTMVPSSASHDVSLVFPAGNRPTIGRGDRDTYVYYIVAPAFGENDVFIKLYATNGQCATFEKRASLQHNKMAIVSLTVVQWDGQPPVDGALPGAFSVSATHQVHFSQGNLQYRASTNTWRFAENQYDYVGSANSNISSNYSGWIDHFGWGTGNNPTLASTNNSDYNSFVDWGTNAISNGGNTANRGWRTLTRDEWYYLLFTRNITTGLRYEWAVVEGTVGLILFPDNWNCSLSELPSGYSYDVCMEVYDSHTWEYEFESRGAVFLPASGYRDGTNVTVESAEAVYDGNLSVDISGFYWSANNTANNNSGYNVHFYSLYEWPEGNAEPYNDYRDVYCGLSSLCRGLSVRLVWDANNN